MTTEVRNRWEASFRRLRIAVIGDFEAADILERSRERVQNAREALGRTPLQPRRPTGVDFTLPSIAETVVPDHNYFALFLDAHGVVSTHKLLACDDDEATTKAQSHAEARAFDVWDGWRFVGRFEAPTPRQVSAALPLSSASRQHPHRGHDESRDGQGGHKQREADQ